MNNRIRFSQFLLRLGTFIHSLPVVIMKPDDLIEFERLCYARPGKVQSWSDDALVDSGLNSLEKKLISSANKKDGKLLLLGVGGGREAIQFAKMGFQVKGVDFIPGMVKNAMENAIDRGVKIEGLVQEISKLDVPENSFDLVWLSKAMYSSIPSRRKRAEMLQKISGSLKPNGIFICQFRTGYQQENLGRGEKIRKAIAKSFLGNKEYELGDILWLNIEFLHLFMSENEVNSELEEAGFFVRELLLFKETYNGGVVCVKTNK